MWTLRSGLDEYVFLGVGFHGATGQSSRTRACCYLAWRTLTRYRKQGLWLTVRYGQMGKSTDGGDGSLTIGTLL